MGPSSTCAASTTFNTVAWRRASKVVPKPGKTGELDAWLLGTTFDARRQATVLNVLDAAHVEDGPIAQAVLPYALPLGFHGNFTAT